MVYFSPYLILVYLFSDNSLIELSVLVIQRDGTTSSHPEQRS